MLVALMEEQFVMERELKFREMIIYQGGDDTVIDDYTKFLQAKEIIDVKYQGETSYVLNINALKIGEAAMLLGAGRETKEQEIDPSVGIVLAKKVGDKVSNGDIIAKIYANYKNSNEAINLINHAYKYQKEYVAPINKILEVIK